MSLEQVNQDIPFDLPNICKPSNCHPTNARYDAAELDNLPVYMQANFQTLWPSLSYTKFAHFDNLQLRFLSIIACFLSNIISNGAVSY